MEFPIHHWRDRSLRRALLRIVTGPDKERPRLQVVRALDGLSLEVRPGDRLGIIGPNGAGKSTLLRVLSGIYHPTSGSVQVTGRCLPLFDLRAGLDEEATGYENILRRGLIVGARRTEIEAKRQEIMAFTELHQDIERPLRTYSTGMTLRLVFAIATAVDGEIVLLDEWIGAGDLAFRSKASSKIDEIVERAGIVVLATHDLSLLSRVCNRSILLHHGRIVATGDTQAIVEQYKELSMLGAVRAADST